MLEQIKIRLQMFGLWSLIAIAIVGTIVSTVVYYNVKYRDVKEYNHESMLLMMDILKLKML